MPLGLEPSGPSIRPAAVPDDVVQIASRLRERGELRLGTSSWTFPGWEGLVYDTGGRRASKAELVEDGLEAYGRHPLLGTVGLDRTWYRPMSAAALGRLARRVPAGFRFLVKAHEVCTLPRFPDRARYGRHRGQINSSYLDAGYATAEVVEPTLEGLGDRLGPLLFQLAPQPAEWFGGPQRFADELFQFLDALPRGPLYAVELRTPRLLTSRYADAIAAVGACHAVTAHPAMPDLATQWATARCDRGPAVVVRWMLKRGLDYEKAKARFAPFDRLAAPDVGTRVALAEMVGDALALGLPTWVIANNKAEGCAPQSLVELARLLTTSRLDRGRSVD